MFIYPKIIKNSPQQNGNKFPDDDLLHLEMNGFTDLKILKEHWNRDDFGSHPDIVLDVLFISFVVIYIW